MARRKYYIPITRSGSSILASLTTQAIDRHRNLRHEKLLEKYEKGEMPEIVFAFLLHPIFNSWVIFIVVAFFVNWFGYLADAPWAKYPWYSGWGSR